MREMQQNPRRPDPLNTQVYGGWSYLELPDAPAQPWIRKQAGTPGGHRTHEKFKSQTLNAEYP
jgi:hypothetical protein